MIFYSVIIVLAVILVTALNGFFGVGWKLTLIWGSVALGVMVAIDIIVAVFVRMIPEKKLDPFGKIFTVSQRERKFYEKLGVRKWKDLIPETGKYLCDFAKDKIAEPNNNEYVLKFLRETCYAGLMHAISIVLSFAALFLPYRLPIVLPVVLTNVFLQALPVMTQRYNRFRLVKLYRYNERIARRNGNG